MEIIRKGKKVGEIIGSRFCKFGLQESKHLLWKFGGVPCIDAEAWDSNWESLREVYVLTNKRRFKIPARVFHYKKQEIDLGWGKQYYCEKDLWNIANRRLDTKTENKLPLSATEQTLEDVVDYFS